ncbi:MAG: cupin domain-containing protein [Bacteroidia bacterium]|nr:cupin domain-containing protein [Bacteroidia bacterium]
MKSFNSSKEQELLEKYALGIAKEEEMKLVEQWLKDSPQLRADLAEITEALENFARAHKKRPQSSMRKRIMDKVFTEGEFSSPQASTRKSLEHWSQQISEFKQPEKLENLHTIMLEKTESRRSMLVWIKEKLEEEVHDKYLESFLVLSGSCNCYFHGKLVRSMQAGESMEIPLHTPHWIEVTSAEPLQLIVQRNAA